MQVTDVRVRRIAKEGKMKAVVSITIDQVFVVTRSILEHIVLEHYEKSALQEDDSQLE